jgi:hypothetical protein
MDYKAIELARKAAQELAPKYPRLLGQVDDIINPTELRAGSGSSQKPDTFEPITIAVAISLASLLLGITQFAYNISKDQNAKKEKRLKRGELRDQINSYLDKERVEKTHDRRVFIETVLDQIESGR